MEVSHSIVDPLFDIFVGFENRPMVKKFQIVTDIGITLNGLIDNFTGNFRA